MRPRESCAAGSSPDCAGGSPRSAAGPGRPLSTTRRAWSVWSPWSPTRSPAWQPPRARPRRLSRSTSSRGSPSACPWRTGCSTPSSASGSSAACRTSQRRSGSSAACSCQAASCACMSTCARRAARRRRALLDARAGRLPHDPRHRGRDPGGRLRVRPGRARLPVVLAPHDHRRAVHPRRRAKNWGLTPIFQHRATTGSDLDVASHRDVSLDEGVAGDGTTRARRGTSGASACRPRGARRSRGASRPG